MYYIFYDMSNNKTKARAIAPSFLYDLEYLQAEMAPKNSWRPQGDLNPCIHRERVVS